MPTKPTLNKTRKIRRLRDVRCSEAVPAAIVDTLMAAEDDDAATRLAYARADAWAHSPVGTPYGAVRATVGDGR